MEEDQFKKQREAMVEKQIARRGITSERVLQAFREVPRHEFVPPKRQVSAYQDRPLPIGEGQTISQPYIVAYMTDRLQVGEEDRVLEIGTGSGYQAAILAELAGEVHTIERHRSLAEETQRRLDKLGYDNVQIYVRDGTLGLPEKAPFQGIIVTASAPEIPPALLEQLDEGGRLIMPVGDRFGQVLKLVVRTGDDYQKEALSPVAFVPLIGEQGWDTA